MAHAAPITRDGFVFAADCFSVATGSGNVHRRQTVAELKAHFKKQEDQPAHWYEAQLIHYGLPPSKVKGTAKMRLMDAVNGGGQLQVPAALSALERELKKEWTKANKAALATMTKKQEPTSAGAASKKRKADTPKSAGSAQAPPKRAKAQPKASPPKPKPTASKTTKAAKAAPPAAPKPKPAPKLAKPDPKENKPKTPEMRKQLGGRTKQTARKTASRDDPWPSYKAETPPPPYPGSPIANRHPDNSSSNNAFASSPNIRSSQPAAASLGYLNGRYEIEWCTEPDHKWTDRKQRGMVCTIEGDTLWVKFDLGYLEGVMRTQTRPRRASAEPLRFRWFGRSIDEAGYPGSEMGMAWLKFVGDGVVKGEIGWYSEEDDEPVRFVARRMQGQQTRSEVSAQDMNSLWSYYME